MGPVVDALREQTQGTLDVVFIDVDIDRSAIETYKMRIKPTQVFLSADGKEIFRHEGYISLNDILEKWKELGIDLSKGQPEPVSRWEPAQTDGRSKDAICRLCDKTIDPKTLVVVSSDKIDARFCSPHCYFIMYSCLMEDKTNFESRVSMTDYSTGASVPALNAQYSVSQDAKKRPVVRVFASDKDAQADAAANGGRVLSYNTLKSEELAHLCGFCDRACYPCDAAEVIVSGGENTWGCCSHCALGVAARTGKDIEVRERDRLTGEWIVVKTKDGVIESITPKTAVAWYGQNKKPDGSFGSAGCFHQGFFTSVENLKKWVEQNPLETGSEITIAKALADKMKLTPQQIQKACKIGECSGK